MKRLFFLIPCIIALFFGFAFSASAAAAHTIYDCTEYATSLLYYGDNVNVTFELPYNPYWYVTNRDTGSVIVNRYGTKDLTFTTPVSGTYSFSLTSAGNGESNSYGLLLENIPNGSSFTMRGRYYFNFPVISGVTQIRYFDVNGKYIKSQSYDIPGVYNDGFYTLEHTFNLNIPENAVYADLNFVIHAGYLNSGYTYTCQLDYNSYSVVLPRDTFISSSDKIQQETNEKLDDMTGYQPEIETPPGGSSVGDVGDIESGLIEDVSGGLDELGSTMEGTLAVLGKYANSLFAVAWLMGKVFDISEFNDLVSVSLGLSVIVLLFSVSLTVSSSISRRSRSSGSKASGKGGGKK